MRELDKRLAIAAAVLAAGIGLYELAWLGRSGVAWVLLGLALAVFILAISSLRLHSGKGVVRVRRYEVVDAFGTLRAILHESGLELVYPEGVSRAAILLDRSGDPTFTLRDRKNRETVVLGAKEGGDEGGAVEGHLSLCRKGKSFADLGGDGLFLWDSHGSPRAELGVLNAGHRWSLWGSEKSKDGAHFTVWCGDAYISMGFVAGHPVVVLTDEDEEEEAEIAIEFFEGHPQVILTDTEGNAVWSTPRGQAQREHGGET